MSKTFEVVTTIDGAHDIHTDYPLLPGDIIVYDEEKDCYTKTAPGLCITGFVLTDEQKGTLMDLDKHPRIQLIGFAEYAEECGVEVIYVDEDGDVVQP